MSSNDKKPDSVDNLEKAVPGDISEDHHRSHSSHSAQETFFCSEDDVQAVLDDLDDPNLDKEGALAGVLGSSKRCSLTLGIC